LVHGVVERILQVAAADTKTASATTAGTIPGASRASAAPAQRSRIRLPVLPITLPSPVACRSDVDFRTARMFRLIELTS
jgi:hypothetical protein